MDLGMTIAPKSDQLNADDLIAGSITIRITKVSANPESTEQPVSLFFEGDCGKPYRPCKSMRRVLVQVWGRDGATYPGRSMTLYRDAKVQFGGLAVGGIRISHMSHIDETVTMALTATRANRKPYTVRPLESGAEPPPPTQTPIASSPDKATAVALDLYEAFTHVASTEEYNALVLNEKTIARRAWLAERRPELSKQVENAAKAALVRVDPLQAVDPLLGGPVIAPVETP